MDGEVSALAKLFLKISNDFTEKEATRLRELLYTDYHLGKADVENKSPQEICNMLERANKMWVLVKVLKVLGKEKLAQDVKNVAKRDSRKDHGVAIRFTLETLQGYMVPALLMIIAICIGLLYLPAVKNDGNHQNTPKAGMTTPSPGPTSQKEDGEKLQRLEQQIKTLQHDLQEIKKTYIKRCESGIIELPRNIIKKEFGERSLNRTENFKNPFDTEPEVITFGLTKMDLPGADVRIEVKLVSVSKTGLTICFTTWNKSELYSAIVNWMVCA
ncbi:PREDICTED: uncharacterized protein LOC109477919 [Branchiostoma belcheri]|uniref:Uncharacterized protein LOC109477919 n=1 Tax=Branchiostoma belcheri TaxID=7741 RepID=A0A6P4Z064_BRABE|nr:PREDICTED: uncharacterized protein LOC109477919 [Branchiostoma belcheri]